MSESSPLAGQAEYRKLRVVGTKSWAIPIPKIYGDRVAKRYGYKEEELKKVTQIEIDENRPIWIELYFLNGKILISPTPRQGEIETVKEYLNSSEEVEIESKVYANYLAGIDKIILYGYQNEHRITIEKIQNRLPGMEIDYINSTRIDIEFYQKYKDPHDRVKKAFELCESFYSVNEMALKDFPDISGLDASGKSPHSHLENDLDNISFGVKRILSIMATRPSAFKNILVDDLRNVFQFNMVLSNIERLANFQEGIARHLCILKDNEIPSGFFSRGEYSIIDYHRDAFAIVRNALNSIEDTELAYQIIKLKGVTDQDSNLKYCPEIISYENRKEIITLINSINNLDDFARWRLNLLEQSIWNFIKIATNIAELGQNMNRGESEFSFCE